MAEEKRVLRMTDEEIQNAIRISMESQEIEDYTFEERYCRGVERVVRPQQDELDRLHYLRLESNVSKKSWEIFTNFINNCRGHPKKVACLWLDGDGEETHRWTYAELYERSRVVAAHLKLTYGLEKGDRVMLAYEPCIEFFAAFWACVGTGIIAVPVCPPDPFNPDSDMTDKLVSVFLDSQPKLFLTSATYKDSIAAAREYLGPTFEKVMKTKHNVLDVTERLWLATTRLDFIPAADWDFPQPDKFLDEDDTAFLQYTSGSTGGAKGVEVKHRSLGINCVNCAFLTGGMGSQFVYQFSIGVSWLPTFHDMGLIGFHITPILAGGTMVYFSPLDFIKNPTMWLRVVSRYRHVTSGAPPFALDLCTRRVTPQELQQLDLSGLEVLVLGAEPIRASYMEEFTKKFMAYGFNPKAYMTCFGMAENMLYVAGKWSNQYEARKVLVDSNMLAQHKLVVYKDHVVGVPGEGDREYYTARKELLAVDDTDNKDCQWLVSSGELVDWDTRVTVDPEDHSPDTLPKRVAHFYRREVASVVTVVNPDTMEECPDGTVGEIWITGGSKATGYFRKPDVNRAQFCAKMKKSVKPATQALLQWAKEHAHLAKDPSKRVDLTTYTAAQLEASRCGVLNLQRYAMDHEGQVEWLRSGDMGVIYDNNIFITGRIKDMVIIRGQNYYADDIEHAVTAGKCAVDVADGAARSITDDPALAPLGYLRPGSAIAYSITVEGDGHDECVARKTRVEGEHLCVMVELADDVTARGDRDSDDDSDDEDAGRRELTLRKDKKSGHQLPAWQRLALKYGGQVINGMSRTYEQQEEQLMSKVSGGNSNARVWRNEATCGERVRLMVQRAFIGSVRTGLSAARALMRLVGELEEEQKDQRDGKDGKLSSSEAGSKMLGEQETRERNRAPDEETLRIKARYTDKQLDEIAAAIRRVVGLRFMLQVGQVVFLAPKSVKKTSSGKKRRAEMVKSLESRFLEQHVVKRSYVRQLTQYLALKEQRNEHPRFSTNHGPLDLGTFKRANGDRADKGDKGDKVEKKPLGGATPKAQPPVKLAGVAANALAKLGDVPVDVPSVLATRVPTVTVGAAMTETRNKASAAQGTQFGGTVGVSVDGSGAAYDVGQRSRGTNVVTQAQHPHSGPYEPPTLLPPVAEAATGNGTNEEQKAAALRVVEELEAQSAALDHETAKSRILRLVVQKVNEVNGGVAPITEDYLREMATKSSAEQQQTLDEYGLDSLTGFELAKSLADEFHLPTAMMGPHLFLQDPTIDGMVGVMVRLVKLHAQKAREEYIAQFERRQTARAAGVSHLTARELEEATAYNYRSTTDPKRIPYILGIGTAVPFSCGPQSEVTQAMLGPMKLDKKTEERFLKISENSGVGTRYSALNSLDDIFWGKEGVNSGNDEYIDARQEVYKRESVKLSIASAADCLRDWMSAKVLKTDEQREQERLERYMDVDKRHRRQTVLKKAAARGVKVDLPEEEAPRREEEQDLTGLSKEVQTYTGRLITHVVAITCTGVIVPGLEFHIMQALGLPLNTQRLSIQFMGCFGAVSGIRCASALAAENPRNRVLVVCTELCTLHMQLNDKIDNLIATALFADGSGAFVVGCDPTPTERPLFAVHSSSSYVIPKTLDMMAWDMRKEGLHIGLAKEIAGEIFNIIGDFVDDMLKYASDDNNPGHRVAIKDCNCGLHPGGPLILNTIQNVLNVPQVGDGHGGGDIDPRAPTAESWEILREYGNMSSATLVFVLDRMREKAFRTGKWTPLVAFGPGLSTEGSLLKAVFPAPNPDGTYKRVAVPAVQQVGSTTRSQSTCADVDIVGNVTAMQQPGVQARF